MSGTANITVRVIDDGQPEPGSDEETFTLTVTNENAPPQLAFIADQITPENTAIEVTVIYSDPDVEDTHTLTVESLCPDLLGVVSGGDESGSVLTITPEENAWGEGSIRITVTDDGNPQLARAQDVRVTVVKTNDPPVLEPLDDLNTDEERPIAFRVNFSDSDADDTHIIRVHGDSEQVSVVGGGQTSGSQFILVPDPTVGQTEITVTVLENRLGGQSASTRST